MSKIIKAAYQKNDEPDISIADNIRNPDDLDLIYKEAARQYDVLNDSVNAQSDKIGVLLGFIFLIIVQVSLTNDLIDNPFHYQIALYIFYLGYLLLLIAAFIGICLFFVRDYPVGHGIVPLMDWFNLKADVNYYQKINDKIVESLGKLISINNERAYYIKSMIIFFSIGVFLVVIPRILSW